MVIKASAAAEIRALVAALDDDNEVRREAAIARLGVIGARAVDRLVAAWPAARASTRAAILRALEPIDDRRALDLAHEALAGIGTEEAAAAVLRRLMESASPATSAGALDILVAAALDERGRPSARAAAREALSDAHPEVAARLSDAAAVGAGPTTRLAGPPRKAGTPARHFMPASRAAPTAGGAAEAPPSDQTLWHELAAGRLTGSPDAWQQAITALPAPPLAQLHRLVDAVRVHEAEPACTEAAVWQTLRGRVHQALAARGSRIALYDLRESFAAATTPLPVAFLAAVQDVGDTSCLEALAQAWARAPTAEGWWREQLALAFRAIVKREKLTRRSAALKKVRARWPGIGERNASAAS